MKRYKPKHVEPYLYFPVCLNCVMLNTHTEKFTFLLTLLFTAQQLLVVQGLLVIEASRSHSMSHTTLGRTPLDEWPARRRYLSTLHHTTLPTDRHPSPRAGFEPAIPATKRLQTHASRPRGHKGTKYDIIRETENTSWNSNPQVELHNSKTYVSGQFLISFRRRTGIGTCSVRQNQKTLQPPVIQWS